jgi:hypothetical protein
MNQIMMNKNNHKLEKCCIKILGLYYYNYPLKYVLFLGKMENYFIKLKIYIKINIEKYIMQSIKVK